MHLRSIELARDRAGEGFPFDVPALAALGELVFETPVTFLVGENGSGKSTLLEALAWASEAVAAGATSLERDPTLDAIRPLGDALRLRWHRRTRRGFFLRAEDFFGFVKTTHARARELRREQARVEAEGAHLPRGERDRIAGPYRASADALETRYGERPDAASHGEQFLAFFRSRFVPGGLHLLDEPEAPLSPQSQLAFLALVKACAEEDDAQFVIATHSPILMALPGATVLSFDSAPPRAVPWQELEQVALMRDFLTRPEAFLRHL